jgi:hypothetical protein
MKRTVYAICAIVMLMSGVSCTTEGGRNAGPAVVTVQFVNPGSFTDFSVQGRNLRDSASVFTQEVTRTLEPVVESRFSSSVLTLRFTNIDLAGRRRSTGASSARVVRNLTRVRLSFDYLLQTKAGRTMASGSQRLVDTAQPTQSGNPNRSRPLFNETRMLQRWLRSLPVR